MKMTKELREDLNYIGAKFESMEFIGKTIFITGATGLIGSFLVKAAAIYNNSHKDPIHIIAMARSQEKVQTIYGNIPLPDIRFLYQDFDCEIHIEKCDYIIHTACPTVSQYFISHPVEVIDTIYAGTKRMLDLAKTFSVKGMVYLSSMEVFGSVSSDIHLSEEDLGYIDIHNVRSSYSEGKRMAECLCSSYAKEYQVPVCSARLAQTFGAGVLEGENRVFAQFARSAVKGENIVLHTAGESMGNYVYLRDAASAILLLLHIGEWGEAYTVVNESSTMTIRQMADMVAENFSQGRSHVVIDIPEGVNMGYAPTTKMKLSSKKIRKLGWKPEIDLLHAYKRMLPDLCV